MSCLLNRVILDSVEARLFYFCCAPKHFIACWRVFLKPNRVNVLIFNILINRRDNDRVD